MPRNTIDLADALVAYRTLMPEAKRSGGEWKGPCPVCGGEDRFWITETKLGCRGCCPGKNNPAAFVAILKALGLGAPRERDLDPGMVRRANETHERWRRKREVQGRKLNEAHQAWGRATLVDGTPGAVYLRWVRLCWPPAVALPPAVRWLERVHLPFTSGLERSVAGAVVFAFTDDNGTVVSVDLEALTAEGRRPAKRWRRTCGLKGQGLFHVNAPGEELQIAEGAVSALAARWLLNAPAVATGGTGTQALVAVQLPRARIHVDGDRAGRKCALAAIDVLPGGIDVGIERYPAGTDAADRLKDELWAGEASHDNYEKQRIGIVPTSGVKAKQEAVHSAIQAAWSHHLSQLRT